MLRAIALQELRQLGEGKHWDVSQHLSELASLEPVKGWMQATHRGDDLWVQAEASTVVELCCDRCLKAFPHRLAVAVEESIALQLDDDSLDPELQLENAAGDPVMDQLDPLGRFDPEHWLFEQLNLQLPLKRLCSSDCAGLLDQSDNADDNVVDPRWAGLLQLKSPPADTP